MHTHARTHINLYMQTHTSAPALMARVHRHLHAHRLFRPLIAVQVDSEGIEMREVPTDAKLLEMAINNPEYVAPLLHRVGGEKLDLRMYVSLSCTHLFSICATTPTCD